MQKIKLILPAVLLIAIYVLAADKLDFSKKRNFYFGDGEYGTIALQLDNYQTFNYQSEVKKPFVLKKINNDGLIELIYDARTLSGEDLTDGKKFSSTFTFTKKNIGKKENIVLSAVYQPEIRFLVQDSLYADFVRINLTPDKRSEFLKINALKNMNNIQIDDPNKLISIGTGNTISLEKGLNDLEITLSREENLEGEVVLYRKAGEGKINELYIVITISGFTSQAVPVAGVHNVPDSIDQDSVDQANLYNEIEETPDTPQAGNGQSSTFSLVSIIIIVFLALLIVVLLIMIMSNKNGILFEKYQTFFDDIATLVNVNIKGTNIDKSIEEIMMILLEKFEYNSSQTEETKVEKKKILKKPANLKSPAVKKQDTIEDDKDSMDFDLDFGKTEPAEKESPDVDKPLDPKPTSNGDKKISRGFDFLDEDN